VHILNYVGEGYWKFWLRGTVDQDQLPRGNERCANERNQASTCDVQITEEPDTVWWATIRNQGGRKGWTRQLDHFGNIDACG